MSSDLQTPGLRPDVEVGPSKACTAYVATELQLAATPSLLRLDIQNSLSPEDDAIKARGVPPADGGVGVLGTGGALGAI